ncbi:unnamed protein product [Amoebophrya sp. A120]|nr:unnamed protein product [Amoebophrya sp. A120]|eukprot:GSA120T00016160001.1
MLRDQARPGRTSVGTASGAAEAQQIHHVVGSDGVVPAIAPNTMFYEPLRFLDDQTRELVELIVQEQLKVAKNEEDFQQEREIRAEKIEEFKQLEKDQEYSQLQAEAESAKLFQKKCNELELELDSEKQRAKNVMNRLQKRNEQLEAEILLKQEENKTSVTNSRNLLAEIQKFKEQLIDVEKEKQKLEKELESIQQTTAKQAEKAKQQEKLIDTLNYEKKKIVDDYEKEQVQLRSANVDLAGQLEQKDELINDLDQKSKSLDLCVQDFLVKFSKVEEDRRTEQNNFEETIKALKENLAKTSEAFEQKCLEAERFRFDLEKQSELVENQVLELQDLQRDFDSMSKTLKEKSELLEKLEDSFSTEKSQTTELRQHYREQVTETNSLRDELATVKKDSEKADLKNKELETENKLFEEQKTLAEFRYTEQSEEFEKAKTKITELEKDFKELEEHKLQMERESAEIQNELKDKCGLLEDEKQVLEEENTNLENRVIILENNVGNLKNIVQLNNEFYAKFGKETMRSNEEQDHGENQNSDTEEEDGNSSDYEYSESGVLSNAQLSNANSATGKRMKEEIATEIERSLVTESSPPLFPKKSRRLKNKSSKKRKIEKLQYESQQEGSFIPGQETSAAGTSNALAAHFEDPRNQEDFLADGPWDFEESCDGSLVVTRRKFFEITARSSNALRRPGSGGAEEQNENHSHGVPYGNENVDKDDQDGSADMSSSVAAHDINDNDQDQHSAMSKNSTRYNNNYYNPASRRNSKTENFFPNRTNFSSGTGAGGAGGSINNVAFFPAQANITNTSSKMFRGTGMSSQHNRTTYQRTNQSNMMNQSSRFTMTRFWDERQSVFTESQDALRILDERLTQNLLWKKFSRTAVAEKNNTAVGFVQQNKSSKNFPPGKKRMAQSLTTWTALTAEKEKLAMGTTSDQENKKRDAHSAGFHRAIDAAKTSSASSCSKSASSEEGEMLNNDLIALPQSSSSSERGDLVDEDDVSNYNDVEHNHLLDGSVGGPQDHRHGENTENEEEQSSSCFYDTTQQDNSKTPHGTFFGVTMSSSASGSVGDGRTGVRSNRNKSSRRNKMHGLRKNRTIYNRHPRNRSAGLRDDIKAAWGEHAEDLLHKTNEFLEQTRASNASSRRRSASNAKGNFWSRGRKPGVEDADEINDPDAKKSEIKRTVDSYGLVITRAHPLLHAATDLKNARLLRKLGYSEHEKHQLILRKLHNFDGQGTHTAAFGQEENSMDLDHEGHLRRDHADDSSKLSSTASSLGGDPRLFSRMAERNRKHQSWIPDTSLQEGEEGFVPQWQRATFPPSSTRVRQELERKHLERARRHAVKKRGTGPGPGLGDPGTNNQQSSSSWRTNNSSMMNGNNDNRALEENRTNKSWNTTARESGGDGAVAGNHENNTNTNAATMDRSKAKWTWTGVQATFGSKEPLSETLRKERRERQKNLVSLLGEILNVGVTNGSTATATNDENLQNTAANKSLNNTATTLNFHPTQQPPAASSSSAAANENNNDTATSNVKDRVVEPWVRDLFLKLRQALLDSQVDIVDLEAHKDAVSSMLENQEKHSKDLRIQLARHRKMYETTVSSSGFRMSKGDQFWTPASGSNAGGNLMNNGGLPATIQEPTSHTNTVTRGLNLGRSNMWSQLTDDMQEQLHATETQLRNTFSKLDVETQQKLEAQSLVTALEGEIRQLEDTFRQTQQGATVPRWDGSDPELMRGYNSDGSEPDDNRDGEDDNSAQQRLKYDSQNPSRPQSSNRSGSGANENGQHNKDRKNDDQSASETSGDIKTLDPDQLDHESQLKAILDTTIENLSTDYAKESRKELLQRLQELEREKEEASRTISRLRLIINEMSMRLVRLKENMESSNGMENKQTSNYEEMFRQSGLGDFLSRDPGNVFNRLYQDAVRRIRKIEDIQNQKQQLEQTSVLRVFFAPGEENDNAEIFQRAQMINSMANGGGNAGAAGGVQVSGGQQGNAAGINGLALDLFQPVVDKSRKSSLKSGLGGGSLGNKNELLYGQNSLTNTNLDTTWDEAGCTTTVTTLSGSLQEQPNQFPQHQRAGHQGGRRNNDNPEEDDQESFSFYNPNNDTAHQQLALLDEENVSSGVVQKQRRMRSGVVDLSGSMVIDHDQQSVSGTSSRGGEGDDHDGGMNSSHEYTENEDQHSQQRGENGEQAEGGSSCATFLTEDAAAAAVSGDQEYDDGSYSDQNLQVVHGRELVLAETSLYTNASRSREGSAQDEQDQHGINASPPIVHRIPSLTSPNKQPPIMMQSYAPANKWSTRGGALPAQAPGLQQHHLGAAGGPNAGKYKITLSPLEASPGKRLPSQQFFVVQEQPGHDYHTSEIGGPGGSASSNPMDDFSSLSPSKRQLSPLKVSPSKMNKMKGDHDGAVGGGNTPWSSSKFVSPLTAASGQASGLLGKSPSKVPLFLSPLSPIVDMHTAKNHQFTGGFAMNRKSPVKNGWK